MEALAIASAFVAGVLSFLNPCVLPLLPLVLAAAASRHRLGSIAMVAGLALSFVAFGILIAAVGSSLGIDGGDLQMSAAILLIAIGAVLIVPHLQRSIALAAAPLANWADRRFGGAGSGGLAGQFGLGLLLGIVWTPCVGPTLGAASVLAAQGRDLGQVALIMTVFALGAALPLVLAGLASREALAAWRGHLLSVGNGGKFALGIALVAAGALVLTGYDKILETALLRLSPEWLNDVTTRY